MKKIIVIGTTGSGKSLVAKELAQKLSVPYIQMDHLFWEPNWRQSSDEDFMKRVTESVQQTNWVLDGNYGKTHHLTWSHADTIIWIDFPFWLTFYQNLKRGISRAITQEELWPGTGNRESIGRLFSKESILVWLFKTYQSNRIRYQERMNDLNYSHLKFIRLRSRQEVRRFLMDL